MPKATKAKRRLQNAVRRSRGKKTVTRIKELATESLEAIYDDTATLPDLAYALETIAKFAGDLDGRRGKLDPSKGGKAV